MSQRMIAVATLAMLMASLFVGCGIGRKPGVLIVIPAPQAHEAVEMAKLTARLMSLVSPGTPVGLVVPVEKGKPPIYVEPKPVGTSLPDLDRALGTLSEYDLPNEPDPEVVAFAAEEGMTLVVIAPEGVGSMDVGVLTATIRSGVAVHLVAPETPDTLSLVGGSSAGTLSRSDGTGGPGFAVSQAVAGAVDSEFKSDYLDATKAAAFSVIEGQLVTISRPAEANSRLLDSLAKPSLPDLSQDLSGWRLIAISRSDRYQLLAQQPVETIVSYTHTQSGGGFFSLTLVLVVVGLVIIVAIAVGVWLAISRRAKRPSNQIARAAMKVTVGAREESIRMGEELVLINGGPAPRAKQYVDLDLPDQPQGTWCRFNLNGDLRFTPYVECTVNYEPAKGAQSVRVPDRIELLNSVEITVENVVIPKPSRK